MASFAGIADATRRTGLYGDPLAYLEMFYSRTNYTNCGFTMIYYHESIAGPYLAQWHQLIHVPKPVQKRVHQEWFDTVSAKTSVYHWFFDNEVSYAPMDQIMNLNDRDRLKGGLHTTISNPPTSDPQMPKKSRFKQINEWDQRCHETHQSSSQQQGLHSPSLKPNKVS